MGTNGGRGSSFSHGVAGRERRRRRRIRAERFHAHWGDVSDLASSGFDSAEERTSSSDEGIGNPKRKRALDNVLFDYFSKQAIGSLKRDLSHLCSESGFLREVPFSLYLVMQCKVLFRVVFCVILFGGLSYFILCSFLMTFHIQNKRSRVHIGGKASYSVYHSKYFFEVLSRLTLEQKAIIDKFGFGCLLFLCKTHLPSSFIRWLALRVDTVCSEIVAGDKTICLPKDAFHFVLGLPNSGSRLVEDNAGGLEFILSLFHLSEAPHITFFGNKLKSEDPMTEEQVFVCFMQIAVSCFLCPSKCDSLDTKFIGQLGDPKRARGFDLCSLVHSHTMAGVANTVNYIQSKGRKPKAFEFCSYGLAVYYLDCLDFGVHVAGSGIPRSVSWRGDMIKMYSDLDRKGRKGFGRRRLRKDLAGCYLHVAPLVNKCCAHCGSRDEVMSARLKESMHDEFASALPDKIIDGIFDTIYRFYSSSCVNSNNPGVLVHNVIQALADARPSFQNNSDLQKDNVHSSFAKLSVSPAAVTPSSLGNKIVDKKSSSTAPVLPPIKKVLSRLTALVPENRQTFGIGQDDLLSPVGRISFTPSSGGKVATKIGGHTAVNNLVVNTPGGSKQIPILVGETTPKPKLVEKSPEVTITGTSSFKQRQDKLAMDTDALYNRTLLGSKYSHVYSARKPAPTAPVKPSVINVEDYKQKTTKDSSAPSRLIILQPKNSLALPLAPNPRFPVSDEEIMHYCAIIDLAYMENIQKDYAIQFYGVHCNFVSLGQTLMPDGHIDTFLIPCFCRKLFEDNHPSKSGRHYFFSYVGESILNYNIDNTVAAMVRTSFIGAATASKGKRLHNSDRLFFPICHEEHWFNFSVDFQWKLFVFIDSYYSPQSSFQRDVQFRLRNNFVTLWNDIFPNNEVDFSNFEVLNGKIPLQSNPHDCGVMTMMAMEYFDPEQDLTHLFSKDDIPHIRIRYANRLFFHRGNKTDLTVVTNFYDKESFMRRLH